MKLTSIVMSLALVGFVAHANEHGSAPAATTPAAPTAAPAEGMPAETTTPVDAKDAKKMKKDKKGHKKGHGEEAKH